MEQGLEARDEQAELLQSIPGFFRISLHTDERISSIESL